MKFPGTWCKYIFFKSEHDRSYYFPNKDYSNLKDESSTFYPNNKYCLNDLGNLSFYIDFSINKKN